MDAAHRTGRADGGAVGGPRRLDFTVIGPAVNRASRLQELTKALGRAVVISEAFARHLDRSLDRPLIDLGAQELRDFGAERVFTLD